MLIERIATGTLKAESLPDDYVEDGILYCGNCHTAKEYEYEIKAGASVIKGKGAMVCDCEQAKLDELEKQNQKLDFEYWKNKMILNGLGKSQYQHYTFENDDLKNPEITDVCKAYVENWEKVKANNLGLLFCGPVGTGKTFYAVAIANALIDKKVSVKVTSIAELIGQMQTYNDENKQRIIDEINHVELLVIDDVGTERDTPFGIEQVMLVINNRATSGKPAIATTNSTLEDLRNPTNIAYKRIYDRALEMCSTQIQVAGKSRRESIQEEKDMKAMKILGLI